MNYEINAVAVLTHSVKQRDGISLKVTWHYFRRSGEHCISLRFINCWLHVSLLYF
jgi:hypothetical protein